MSARAASTSGMMADEGRRMGGRRLRIEGPITPSPMQSPCGSCGSQKRNDMIVAWKARMDQEEPAEKPPLVIPSPQASFHEIESLRQKNVELTEEVERLRSHTESLQNEGYTLRSQFSVVETSKSVTNKVLQDLTKEVLGLRTSNVELEEDLHDALNREQRMSQEMEEMKEKISDLQLTVEKLTIENEVLLCKEASLEEFVLEVEEKLRSCEQALASALEEARTSQRQEDESLVTQKEEEIARLSLLVDEQKAQNESLAAECAEIRTFLQTTTASKEETIFTLRFELAEKSGILENLQGECFNLRESQAATSRETRLELERLSASESQKTLENNELKERLQAVQKALAEREDEVSKMTSQLAMKSECQKQLQVEVNMMRERQQATQETQKVEVSKLLDLLNEAKERELKAQKLQAEHENLCHEYEAQLAARQLKEEASQSRNGLARIPLFILKTGITAAATLGAYHGIQQR